MKSLLKISVLAAALLVATGCEEEFERINTNPNVFVTTTPELLLPGVINNVCGEVLGTGWSYGNIVIQHTAKIQFVNEDRYAWGEVNGIWNTVYSNMRNVKAIIDIAESNTQNNYKAVGLIMKSWMFSLVTDTYGDAPYSQATQAKSDVNFPVYDTQEAIYNGILNDLQEANELLGTSNEKIGGDILFGGDVAKWKKLANSLRLRALMRISGKRSVGAEMQAIVSNPAEFPIFTSNADNAALKYLAASPNQFPLHTTRVGSFDEFRLSKTLGDTLKSLGDPRLTVFARPTAADATVYAGIPNGLNDVDALTYNGGAQFISRVGPLYFENAITDEGREIARGVIMTYPELQFILAEAAEKGLISTGTAKGYYEAGIEASFGYFRQTMPAGYLALPQVSYDAALSQQDRLNLIGFQKWISLFFHGMEAWYDWRRTNIPALKPGRDNLNNNLIPVRFIYPVIEQSLNGDSRAAAVTRQGEDVINTKVWWDQ
ncbi:MAG: SusD/RagB family nutrient-binding outer membrane lipoprotein [Bacteroidia bacterium]|nr:SusD/RagB family nutrient-binding outer membrane lipoprotein [Bacteroidia bacterium]